MSRIERFFASRGFYTRNLNPPRITDRFNKPLFRVSRRNMCVRASFGWGHYKIGFVKDYSGYIPLLGYGLIIRVPLLSGYQLSIRISKCIW